VFSTDFPKLAPGAPFVMDRLQLTLVAAFCSVGCSSPAVNGVAPQPNSSAAPQPQQTTAPITPRWSHQFFLYDDFEDFWADGAASAYRAEINVDSPVSITVGRVEGSNDPADTQLAAHREWLNGWYESAPITVDGGFEQALLSWNVQPAEGTGVCVELRVRESSSDAWSDWLYVGDWGEVIPPPIYVRTSEPGGPRVEPDAPKRVAIDGAQIDVDYFSSERLWRQAQFRVRTDCAEDAQNRRVRLRRFACCFSRRTDEPASKLELPAAAIRRLDVPFRSQKTVREDLADRICSPTSVTMAMAYRGVEVDTVDAADRIYDAAHSIYGNWTRAVQGAYSFGVPGYLQRFSDWNEVASKIAEGTPLVISIAAQAGELDGAPYPKTDGHLLVVCGFDEHGNVQVNDPAARTPEAGRLVYRRDQLERVWMARGGTAYVFLPRDKR